jgi:hypothetical protein
MNQRRLQQELEQLKLWQDEVNRRRSQELEVLGKMVEYTIQGFLLKFRSHALHDRTWRPIPYWCTPGLSRGHRMWVEFQLSKKAMAAILA